LLAQSMDIQPPADQLRSVSSLRYPIDVLNHKIGTEPLEMDTYKFQAGDFSVTAITPVLIAKIQVMHERRRVSNRHERRGNTPEVSEGIQDTFYEWHRSTETALDYAVTFEIRPESRPISKPSLVSRMFRFGKTGKTEMEFKGEFLEFRIFRDGTLLEPIMPGRVVVQGASDQKNRQFVDQAYAGSYVYLPDEFMTGTEFRLQIIDARAPEQIHKEVVLGADSKLVKQLRADFSFNPGILVSRVP